MPDLESDVPKQGEKTLDVACVQLVVVALEQDQKINVRRGMQFTTPLATDSNE